MCHYLSRNIIILKELYFIAFEVPRCLTLASFVTDTQTIASVAFILWRVKKAANKQCCLASMCKYNTQGSYSYNHCSGQRGSTIDH
jgi:hypothetical protein